MSDATDRLEAAAAALAVDAETVRAVVNALRGVVAELKAGSVSEDRLAAIAASLEASDAAIDAVTNDPPGPPSE